MKVSVRESKREELIEREWGGARRTRKGLALCHTLLHFLTHRIWLAGLYLASGEILPQVPSLLGH